MEKTYPVSLCLSIVAEDEQEALEKFYDMVCSCDFDPDSVDVEEEEI